MLVDQKYIRLCATADAALQADIEGQVLVVGTPLVGKYTLTSRLIRPAKALSKQSDSKQLWQLDTKYYTAAVNIRRLPPSDEAHQLAVSSPGLVLVFNANLESSFLTVSKWAEQLPSSVADVRLCVANKVDQLLKQTESTAQAAPDLQRSSWLQDATTWCAKNQFEYIETSSTNRQIDMSLIWEEQQQGVLRVRQALEANYWPGLKMKQLQSQTRAPEQEGNQELSHTGLGNGINHADDSVSGCSGQLEAELDSFDAYQSAEEAELDQFDKMFGELRGRIN